MLIILQYLIKTDWQTRRADRKEYNEARTELESLEFHKETAWNDYLRVKTGVGGYLVPKCFHAVGLHHCFDANVDCGMEKRTECKSAYYFQQYIVALGRYAAQEKIVKEFWDTRRRERLK